MVDDFRKFLARFFRPHTRIGASAVDVAAGLSNAQLLGFLNGQRGIPHASTLRLLAPETRRRLEAAGLHELAQECTVVRFLLEAGYMQRSDVAEYLEVEGCDGWRAVEDLLDLTRLSAAGQETLRDLYAFQLEREGIRNIGSCPVPEPGMEPATEVAGLVRVGSC